MYVRPNFKTKKTLKDAVAKGDKVEVFSPGPFPAPTDGTVTVEGPHYPERTSGTPVVSWLRGM